MIVNETKIKQTEYRCRPNTLSQRKWQKKQKKKKKTLQFNNINKM